MDGHGVKRPRPDDVDDESGKVMGYVDVMMMHVQGVSVTMARVWPNPCFCLFYVALHTPSPSHAFFRCTHFVVVFVMICETMGLGSANTGPQPQIDRELKKAALDYLEEVYDFHFDIL